MSLPSDQYKIGKIDFVAVANYQNAVLSYIEVVAGLGGAAIGVASRCEDYADEAGHHPLEGDGAVLREAAALVVAASGTLADMFFGVVLFSASHEKRKTKKVRARQ